MCIFFFCFVVVFSYVKCDGKDEWRDWGGSNFEEFFIGWVILYFKFFCLRIRKWIVVIFIICGLFFKNIVDLLKVLISGINLRIELFFVDF